MSKPVVSIYINPDAQSTTLLNKFLAKNIDHINEYLFIRRIKVNSANIASVKKKGIDHTPTLVYGQRKFVSLEKIIKILTPPANNKAHYGYGNANPDDLIQQYQNSILDGGEEDESPDEMNPETRSNTLRQKDASFIKRRSQITGSRDANTKSR